MASIFTIGRICYKTTGRDAGSRVVVLEAAKSGFAIVEGPATKKGKINLAHLLPTPRIIRVPDAYTRKDLVKMMEKGD